VIFLSGNCFDVKISKMGDLSKKKSSLGPIKQISKSLFKNVKFDKYFP
jgi:hypothetical protein